MSLNLFIDLPEDDDEPWTFENNIFTVLNDYLQPASQQASEDAASKLIELVRNENANPEGILWQTWDIVFQVAEQVPSNHASQDRLVELIARLRDAQPPNPFGELKNMGPALTERFNQIPSTPPAAADEAGGGSPWENLNALAARLTRAGLCTRVSDAVNAISLSLESRPDPRSRAYRSRGLALNFHVPIAADWVVRCGDELHREMRSGGSEDAGCPWKGRRGVFEERWAFWKEQLGDIARNEEACEERVREVAGLAARRMGEVEGDAGGGAA